MVSTILFLFLLMVFVVGSFKLLGLLISDTLSKSITGTVIFGILSAMSIIVLSILGFMCIWANIF